MASWLRVTLTLVGALLLLLTLLSLLPTEVWWVQALGFPREQAAAGLALLSGALLLRRWPTHPRRWAALLGASLVALGVQTSYLWPYLPGTPQAVPSATIAQAQDSTSRLRLLISNVLISNRQAQPLLQLVGREQPDLLLALEPDAWWARALRPLHARYPYRVSQPNAAAYGMILYSRLPLTDSRVLDLLQQRVPAIRTRLRLRSGQQVDLFAIHPTPPVPDNFPDGVGLRARALREVATLAQANARPTLVAGDYNDVSWSASIHQLPQLAGLRDVNVGRGFFNTFNAEHWWLRWPLDHCFVSAQWRVVEVRRLPAIGSDHFPLLVTLSLPPQP
jgi:endonuclease/exonuclease/phosphatase (EEP) superfamily protein YafD